MVLAACAAGTPTTAPADAQVSEPSATAVSAEPATAIPEPTSIPTDASAPTVAPVATSRGPELHATDPATVKLASGGLQLVEFFRFT